MVALLRTLAAGVRAIGAAAWLLFGSPAWPQAADTYPSRPIRLIVPFPPAGPTDTYAHLIAKMLGEGLGQIVVVDNKPGATGLIGTIAVKESAPDGYTLLYTSNSAQVIGPLLQKPRPFDPVTDFTPIIEPLRYPLYLIASNKLPAKTFSEFITLARSRPDQLNYSSVGNGSGGHLTCELLNSAAGITATHVPYKGAAAAQTAVVMGEVDYMCDSVGNSQPLVAAGRIKGLAVTGSRRLAAASAVPSMTESGVRSIEAYIWQGVFAPKGLQPEVRNKLARELVRIMNSPELQSRTSSEGYEVIAAPPEQFAREMEAEKAMSEKIIASKNIKAG